PGHTFLSRGAAMRESWSAGYAGGEDKASLNGVIRGQTGVLEAERRIQDIGVVDGAAGLARTTRIRLVAVRGARPPKLHMASAMLAGRGHVCANAVLRLVNGVGVRDERSSPPR